MKRFIVIIIGLLLTFAITACGNGDSQEELDQLRMEIEELRRQLDEQETTPEPAPEQTPTPEPTPEPTHEPEEWPVLNCWIQDEDGFYVLAAEGEMWEAWCFFSCCGIPSWDLMHPELRSDFIQFHGLPFTEYLQSRFGQARIIIAEEDSVIENDYFVANIHEGFLYLDWFFPVLEEIVIPFIHDLTGLYLPDSGERFHIVLTNFDPWEDAYGAHSAYAERNEAGVINMGLNIRPNDFDGRANPIDHWGASALMFPYFHIMAHEYAHVLSFAFTMENRPRPGSSRLHEEGHACYIDAITVRELFGIGSRSGLANISSEDRFDMISDIAHNNLAYALSSHTLEGSLNNPIQNGLLFGGLFYYYLYENHGNQHAIEVLTAMNRQMPNEANVLTVINDILGADISVTFPEWIDNNRNLVVPLAFTG